MLSKIKYFQSKINYRCLSEVSPNKLEKYRSLSHRKRMKIYLNSEEHIEKIKSYIPERYLNLKTRTLSDNLYLIDSKIATDIAKRIIPLIRTDIDQVICETNAGLGFLTSELLDHGLKWIRIYETCPDFRITLKEFNNVYPGRVELFVKDLFHIWKMSYMDKSDKGSRVAQFLKGVPKRNWSDDPVLTIIGPMPKIDFLLYVFKMICLQNEIATYGRMELFVIMRPGDYLRLTAGPQNNLHTYQINTVHANVFCDCEILEKYPRTAFLPWEPSDFLASPRTRMFKKYDYDKLYLVHIKFKKEFPLNNEQLLPFYFFVKQVFRRGTIKIIPELEKWCLNIGQQIILDENPLFKDTEIDIFTKSGELTPLQLMEIFKIFYKHPGYHTSSLTAMVEAELIKYETVESDMANLPKSTT